MKAWQWRRSQNKSSSKKDWKILNMMVTSKCSIPEKKVSCTVKRQGCPGRYLAGLNPISTTKIKIMDCKLMT